MTHIASRGKEEVPYCFYSISHRPKKRGSLPICRDIHMCRHNKFFTAPIFIDNFTAPTFSEFYRPHIFVTILHILHYIIYRPHFLTTAFTAPIFRHPRNYRPAPTPFFVNFDGHRPTFWRWGAHMYQNFRGSPPPPSTSTHPHPTLILSQMTPGK